MPFNESALQELLRREGVSQRGLALDIDDFLDTLSNRDDFPRLSQSYLSELMGGNKPGSMPAADLLCLYAFSKGYDFTFYVNPPDPDDIG